MKMRKWCFLDINLASLCYNLPINFVTEHTMHNVYALKTEVDKETGKNTRKIEDGYQKAVF